MKRQVWLLVAAASVNDSQTIYSKLKYCITTWAQINIDSNGNVTYYITTTQTSLASVKRFLTNKDNKEKLGIMQSGVLENNVQKGWPRKKASSKRSPIEQKTGTGKQTAFQRLIKQLCQNTKKEQSDKNK